MAMTVTTTFLEHLLNFLSDEKLRLILAPDAAPAENIMPTWWKNDGDGRARNGQERIWITSDMTLTIKVCLADSKIFEADVKGGLWVKLEPA